MVQDCLQLMHSLLRKNPSTQRMFRWAAAMLSLATGPAACGEQSIAPAMPTAPDISRKIGNGRFCRELGMIGLLPALLRLKQRGGSIARQQASNLICVLETLRVLIASEKVTMHNFEQKPVLFQASHARLWQCTMPVQLLVVISCMHCAHMQGIISAEALAADAESQANQDAILKSGVLDILIAAPLGDGAISSAAVRTQVDPQKDDMQTWHLTTRLSQASHKIVLQDMRTPAEIFLPLCRRCSAWRLC